MKTNRFWIIINVVVVSLFFAIHGCKQRTNPDELKKFTDKGLVRWNEKLTDVIVSDIFTPPVASRIYVYPNIAAYEVMCNTDNAYQSYSGRLNGLKNVPKPKTKTTLNFPIAAIIAFSTVSKQLVFNRDSIERLELDYIYQIKNIGIDEKILQNSIKYGEKVGNSILEWASKDGYKERTAMSRYQIKEPTEGTWKPTPPGYVEAIEPNWKTLRTYVMDSVSQFKPPPPTPFDTIVSSRFYKENQDVYNTVNNLSPENLEKAKFWDCNPNISYTQGHIMYFKQQISPGGHWMLIASTVVDKEELSPLQASETFSLVGIAIADAFISCWAEKYNSSLIRPESYINTFIDPDWKPILQTPAFPEYTSGHSVASTSAATVLTELFGENYAFIDSTEVKYGLSSRAFKSFFQASEEAAISRLYGGIHYMPAIENGVLQGKQIGNLVINKLKRE